jgi:hypothetical protein
MSDRGREGRFGWRKAENVDLAPDDPSDEIAARLARLAGTIVDPSWSPYSPGSRVSVHAERRRALDRFGEHGLRPLAMASDRPAGRRPARAVHRRPMKDLTGEVP